MLSLFLHGPSVQVLAHQHAYSQIKCCRQNRLASLVKGIQLDLDVQLVHLTKEALDGILILGRMQQEKANVYQALVCLPHVFFKRSSRGTAWRHIGRDEGVVESVNRL